MAFVLRQPYALSTALKRVPQINSAAVRAFHSSSARAHIFTKSVSPISSLTKSRNAFQSASRRTYMQQPYEVPRPDSSTLTQRLLYGAGIVGATVLATNLVFNRETREDGGMPPYERKYLNDTFLHTGLGLGIIGVAAQALHRSGWSYRIMAANPWVVVGLGIGASIGTMYGCWATSPDKYVPRNLYMLINSNGSPVMFRNMRYGEDSILPKPQSYRHSSSYNLPFSLELAFTPWP